jgi:hypothetical protein
MTLEVHYYGVFGECFTFGVFMKVETVEVIAETCV